VAGWDWTVQNLDYALKFVPKEKLSLGIPVYGYHWFAGAPIRREDPETKRIAEHPNSTAEYISGPNAELLAKEYKGTVQWDADDRTAWFYINRDQMREWVFFTDKRTFEERYKLAGERGIEGFCSWVLGEEDPAIWEVLGDRK
jgi:spore germination protein YaaH